MTITVTLWLNRLLSSSSGAVRLPVSIDRKPMEIEVERLPDFGRERELAFGCHDAGDLDTHGSFVLTGHQSKAPIQVRQSRLFVSCRSKAR